jgi:hypothetical protein
MVCLVRQMCVEDGRTTILRIDVTPLADKVHNTVLLYVQPLAFSTSAAPSPLKPLSCSLTTEATHSPYPKACKLCCVMEKVNICIVLQQPSLFIL